MKLSMYQASVPVCLHALRNLHHILEKGEAFAGSRDIDTAVLFNSRLAPDMFPLSRQVQIASDVAKGCGARLAGEEPPKFDDEEKTWTDLYERINRTIAFLEKFTPAQIDGSEEKEITLQTPNTTLVFTGVDYLLYFVHPNMYFHVTTAYDILRHNGVDVGKLDFLGKVPTR